MLQILLSQVSKADNELLLLPKARSFFSQDTQVRDKNIALGGKTDILIYILEDCFTFNPLLKRC